MGSPTLVVPFLQLRFELGPEHPAGTGHEEVLDRSSEDISC